MNEGKRVLLIVDEAQGLPRKAIEELRMLSNFSANGRSLLQSFLLGQREFRQTMRSEGFEKLRQRVIAAYHLKPLDESETGSYVRHRLSRVGWSGQNPKITDDVYERIYHFTAGVPRRINTLCDRLLLYGYLEELRELGAPQFDAVARDIIEEYGGPSDDAPEAPPELVDSTATHAVPGNGAQPVVQLASPEAKRLAAVESSVETLAGAIKDVLGRAIEAGGTTLRDFYGGDGEPGYFRQQLEVYDREGEHCRACNTVINAIVQGQRTTYYCKNCQT